MIIEIMEASQEEMQIIVEIHKAIMVEIETIE
jgi:hypothetical protein